MRPSRFFDPDAETVEVLLWSEHGCPSGGNLRGSDRLSSPSLPELSLPISDVFKKV